MEVEAKGSVISAILWMTFLSLILFWLPVFGSLIAGVVGGKKAGGVGAAMMAVFIPAIIVGIGTFFLTTLLSGLPMIGFVASLGGLYFALMNVGPLLLGAIIGGILANS